MEIGKTSERRSYRGEREDEIVGIWAERRASRVVVGKD